MWCIQDSCGSAVKQWLLSSRTGAKTRWKMKTDERNWKKLKEGKAPAKGDPFWSSFQQLRRNGLSTKSLGGVSCELKGPGEWYPQHKESANSTGFYPLFYFLSCDLNLLNRSLVVVFYQRASWLPSLTQLHSWPLASCNSMGGEKPHNVWVNFARDSQRRVHVNCACVFFFLGFSFSKDLNGFADSLASAMNCYVVTKSSARDVTSVAWCA